MTSDPRVTMKHIRAAGLCALGARGYFRSRDMDFRAFLKDGLPIEEVRALNDPIADKVVAAWEAANG